MLTRLLNLPMRAQENIALAFLGVITIAGGILFFQAVFVLVNQKETIQGLREHAGKLTQLARLKDSIKSQPNETENGEGLLLVAPSASIARADLQSRITAIAQSHNAVVASVGDVPDILENGLKLIGVRANISGVNEAIQKTLQEMESAKPPLLVREFSIQMSGLESRDRPSELSVQFQVYGAIRAQDEETVKAAVAPLSEKNQ